ncbi:hypothetical protein GGI04_004894 [Coemansia thaxteri]|uniref:Peptidase S1 domain-containing protein n=1 Tax=Coemansia thaxteri TaxID=2663907 RepID=A0A9W8BP88_9FUNG|nr:hypothetical protein GGI04_004894 [Coemansia thaxteri]KAJ2008470.1 hypothetical protein H4R26_000166 [Coemansia thaxteri]KAJ2471236.1 hypothetical protein GGI02_002407 [Coemansia sp. RSA 2322]KAJ2479870.1 hypothetical protein EV174_003896 [Coemansia sp. RSA 2320]
MKISTVALAAVATAGSGALGFEKYAISGSPAAAALTSVVANVVVQQTQGNGVVVCTGAFISPTVLLTSAKCVADPVSNKALASASVMVGQGSADSALAAASTNGAIDTQKLSAKGYFAPQSVFVHPGYNSIAFTDNVAVLVLAQPLANATSAKLIVTPSAATGASYTALGISLSVSAPSGNTPPRLEQLSLKVGSNSTCTGVWAPYAQLTNSLCLVPAKTSSNVCSSDAMLVKTAADNSVGLAGLLNIVAVKGEVPTAQCTTSGVVDFFTTFANYVSWLTQITPLKQSDFVSSAKYNYDSTGDQDLSSASQSASDSEDDAENSSLTHVESTHTSAAAGLKAAASLALLVSALAGSLI